MSSRKRRGRHNQNHNQQHQVHSLEKSPKVAQGKTTRSQLAGTSTKGGGGNATSGKKSKQPKPGNAAVSKVEELLGFSWDEVRSWDGFVGLMYRPTDPACLGVIRFLFGLLMVLDIPQERGLGNADIKWGNPKDCHFPLFDFLQPLGLEWMCILYLCMWIGAFGIMLGLFFHISCFLFLVPYWYMLLLDKASWNNHSYLYGLVALLLFGSRANHYWSVDGVINPVIGNSHIPLWNYAILRFQFFLMYFLAGLKKIDSDWLTGYSMTDLAAHWVFDPMKLLLTQQQIDFWIVHWGGFLLDLTVGFWLFFDFSRPAAMVFCSLFHLMNSQLFTIGMFPYVCLATMPLFCQTDWPKKCLRKIPGSLQAMLPTWHEAQSSSDCIYRTRGKAGKNQSNGMNKKGSGEVRKSSTVGWTHKMVVILLGAYVSLQCFLPYSHFITKGYNNWTNGLYGYSWDMMVHNWLTLHAEVTVKDKLTGELHYVDPDVWVQTERWNSHADMAIQYSHCLHRNLASFNLSHVEVYVDVWKSLNGRFQQRVFDPRVDLLTADWTPFRSPPWLMPLLTHLSPWRERFREFEDDVRSWSPHADVVFVADFPGLSLENYISKDLANITIEVLEGKVIVQLGNDTNTTLTAGQKTEVLSGEFHHVHTISEAPSCYMYVYFNATALALSQGPQSADSEFESEPPPEPQHRAILKALSLFLYEKARIFERSMWFVVNSVLNLTLSVPMVKRLPVKGEASGLKD